MVQPTLKIMQINISSNYKSMSRSLNQVGQKQLPFAFAKALNKTMNAVEKYPVARTYPRAFDVRNRAFYKASMFTGTAVRRATKTKLRVSARDLLIVVTFSCTQRVGLNTLGQEALLSHRASQKRREERGAFERRYDPALSSIPRKASLIVGVLVMRSTNDMVSEVARSGCSTFCNPEYGYGNGSASMKMLNGSPALYH